LAPLILKDASPASENSKVSTAYLIRSRQRGNDVQQKDKAFARKVKREDIVNGAAALGVDLDEHIAFCTEALQGIADKLGLDGSAAKVVGSA
jgi:hypothetical protein